MLHDLVGLALETAILYYVRAEYIASEKLNEAIGKKYKGRKKRVSADKIIKAVLQQEATQ